MMTAFPEPGHCIWRIGDCRKSGFHFCGKPNARGRVYCAFHAGRADGGERPR